MENKIKCLRKKLLKLRESSLKKYEEKINVKDPKENYERGIDWGRFLSYSTSLELVDEILNEATVKSSDEGTKRN